MKYEEINEPIDLYKNRYQEEYRQNTANLFEDFYLKSQVDEKENKKKVIIVRKYEALLAIADRKRFWLNTLRITFIILASVGAIIDILFILPFIFPDISSFRISPLPAILSAIAWIASPIAIFKWVNVKIDHVNNYIEEKEDELAIKINDAWNQMAPLNKLFEWDTISKLIMKTLPIFTLDKYFSNARLDELITHFGMTKCSHSNNSMVFCQSGALNGNPFVISESRQTYTDSKDYTGSLRISWIGSESYTDSNGKSRTRTVTKYQTLYATVTKPFPEYETEKILIYGNEAAPDLSFTRRPTKLASSSDGFFGSMKLKFKIKALEDHSQKMASDYRIMSNKEFEAIFSTEDRNNEVQYRLLFTPLAQREMTKLLEDEEVGFGDDFLFTKEKQINIIEPEHLLNINISASPNIYRNYELAELRKVFNDYSNAYFKAFYFSFAPLLTIPLYQQLRSELDIYKDVYGQGLSAWDCETIANDHGHENFKHSESITENILKVNVKRENNTTIADVTAHGFKGINRIDYVEKYGNDGRFHSVPVEWVEYIPVKKTSPLILKETGHVDEVDFLENHNRSEEWKSFFKDWNVDSRSSKYRKSIVSFIPTK